MAAMGSRARTLNENAPGHGSRDRGLSMNGTLLSLSLTESCRLNDWMVQPKARCAGSGSRGTMPTSR